MKIVIYTGVIPSTTFIEALIKAVADAGHEVFLFGRKDKSIAYPQMNIHIRYIPKGKTQRLVMVIVYWLRLIVSDFAMARRVWNIINNEHGNFGYFINRSAAVLPVLLVKPDIFHLQWAKALQNWIFLLDFDIRIAVSLRGSQINYGPIADPELAAFYRKNFPKADGFHGVSQAIVDLAQGYGAPPDRCSVIYSYVSPAIVAEYSSKEKNKKTLKVISIGRFHWIKGYQYAINAVGILHKKGLPISYTIVADGDGTEYLHHVSDQELQDVVFFKPAMHHKDIIQLIKEADVLVLPSVEEGIANVVLEAMAVGTLVITTDCGGMREVVADGITGFVVPVRNAEAMALALEQTSKLSNETYNQLTAFAHRHILNRHVQSKFTKDFVQFYQQVVSN